jgi:hypothetical protein
MQGQHPDHADDLEESTGGDDGLQGVARDVDGRPRDDESEQDKERILRGTMPRRGEGLVRDSGQGGVGLLENSTLKKHGHEQGD